MTAVPGVDLERVDDHDHYIAGGTVVVVSVIRVVDHVRDDDPVAEIPDRIVDRRTVDHTIDIPIHRRLPRQQCVVNRENRPLHQRLHQQRHRHPNR